MSVICTRISRPQRKIMLCAVLSEFLQSVLPFPCNVCISVTSEHRQGDFVTCWVPSAVMGLFWDFRTGYRGKISRNLQVWNGISAPAVYRNNHCSAGAFGCCTYCYCSLCICEVVSFALNCWNVPIIHSGIFIFLINCKSEAKALCVAVWYSAQGDKRVCIAGIQKKEYRQD